MRTHIIFVKWTLFIVATLSLFAFAPAKTDPLTQFCPEFRALYQQANPALKKSGGPLKLPKPVQINKDGTAEYGAIIYTSNPEALRALNIPIHSICSNFVTSRISADMLPLLVKSSQIKYIQSSHWEEYDNDIAVAYTGADLLHSGYMNETGYTGEGVLVCIIDTGIDWTHPDFCDPQNPSRSQIYAIWDQTLEPIGSESSPSEDGCNYGVEYFQSDINNELDGSPANFIRTTDTDGHGTHVAGTAAGNGASLTNQRFKGMAPEATLLIIRAGESSFPTTNIIDALNYALQKAQHLGLPIVVSMSIGTYSGPHDGSDPKSEAINEFCMSDNGRVVVVSAGNDGNASRHISGTLSGNSSENIYFIVPEYTPETGTSNDDWWFECWFNDDNAISAQLRSPNGHVVNQNLAGSNSVESNDGAFGINNYTSVSNSDRYVSGYIWDETEDKTPAQGNWRLRLTNPLSNSRTFHLWITNEDIGEDSEITLQNADSNYSLSNTAKEAIVVANWAHRWRWLSSSGESIWLGSALGYDDIASSSSVGPTRDNRMKPDLAAPGRMMGSCVSKDASYSESHLISGELHAYKSGTSMSTPVVAGGVALLLQKWPELTHEDIKDIILNETDTDEYTGFVWNKYWGYGKFNIFESMSALSYPSLQPKREVLNYTDWEDSHGYYYDEGGSVSLRFEPTIHGNLTGLFFHTSTDCQLSEAVKIQLWSDDNGKPDRRIGPTHYIATDDFYSYNWNYTVFDPSTYSVNANTSYHIVITGGRTDKISYKVDDSPTDPRCCYKNYSNTTWESRDFNFRFRPVITPDQSLYPTDVKNMAQTRMEFGLSNAWPNPFNPTTHFSYTVPKNQDIHIAVFDIRGRKVNTLYSGMQSSGTHQITWEAKDNSGTSLPSGIYFIQLHAQEKQLTQKVMLIR